MSPEKPDLKDEYNSVRKVAFFTTNKQGERTLSFSKQCFRLNGQFLCQESFTSWTCGKTMLQRKKKKESGIQSKL